MFEEEWREVFQHRFLHVKELAPHRKSISELVAKAHNAYPGDQVTNVHFMEEADAAFILYTKTGKAVSVNPYTAAVIGHRQTSKDFMNVVLKIHTSLLLGKFGTEIIRWNVAIFFIICLSGLVLWWPRQKRFFKQAALIKWKTTNWRRLNWGLHSVLGFYALIVLLIVSLTGIFWVFDSAKKLVTIATGSSQRKLPTIKSVPTLLKKKNILDSAYYYGSMSNPGAKEVFITVPMDSTAPIRIWFSYPYTLISKETTVWFDQYNNAKLYTDSYHQSTRYEKVSRTVYDFHTGRIKTLGIGSKIIYFLASLFAASLPVTGFLIWWGRKNKRKISRQITERKSSDQ